MPVSPCLYIHRPICTHIHILLLPLALPCLVKPCKPLYVSSMSSCDVSHVPWWYTHQHSTYIYIHLTYARTHTRTYTHTTYIYVHPSRTYIRHVYIHHAHAYTYTRTRSHIRSHTYIHTPICLSLGYHHAYYLCLPPLYH